MMAMSSGAQGVISEGGIGDKNGYDCGTNRSGRRSASGIFLTVAGLRGTYVGYDGKADIIGPCVISTANMGF